MKRRLFVEKKSGFQVEAHSLLQELNSNLKLNLSQLRLLNVYDLFGFENELVEKCRFQVFGEIVTDTVCDTIELNNQPHIAIEFLPGQFDQRASSAIDCVQLINPEAQVNIKSSVLYIFEESLSKTDLKRIQNYLINSVECRPKNLEILADNEQAEVIPVAQLENFTELKEEELSAYCKSMGLAMNAEDLQQVINYFKKENRQPYETELRILDTYWSDHCRHTTFTTHLQEITIEESFMRQEMEESLDLYYKMRQELNRESKTNCLMELATIGARYLKSKGFLDDMEVSEENNACSIFVNVEVNDSNEKWLLQFKNETHNHPTEIEPFGGASTCLGGAIRDPLSGRSYVYQAMRVTGAGDIYLPIEDTLEGKLPQRVISTKACHGYSSYGNQIGLATTHVREIYHPNYVAKRCEVGAVVGAVKADAVRRESPVAGDIVLMFGGRTGRDGVGGATGSSKEHNVASLETCSSEVQKGNAPEERKLERLFRRSEVTRLIKKSNDFGAGGVSVAIGELTDGLDIYLDRVKTKYSGLNATELAISESQERMSVVIEAKDKETFMQYCTEENIEVIHIADVTSTNRMRMYLNNRCIVDLKRDFIDSAGAPHYTSVNITKVDQSNPFKRTLQGQDLKERILNNLSSDNVLSQKGLIEQFDASIGASTVLMPFGGKTQRSETQVSVQKLPVLNATTNTASIMAYGYNPFITSWSPYHGAAYAVVEACTKVVAAGARYDKMRFSYQEYFERMSDASSWGKPLSALLGALKMQEALKLPSIGGKDSMSGTFQDINVPPMLMAFGITTVNAQTVISPEFKKPGNHLYLIQHTPLKSYMPNTDQLKTNFDFISSHIENKTILSAYALGFGGLNEAVCKMAYGNEIGANITLDESQLFDYQYGSMLVESTEELNFENAHKIGHTLEKAEITINDLTLSLNELYQANTEKYTQIYADKADNKGAIMSTQASKKVFSYPGTPIEKPIVFVPVFPGTNCDYDTIKAFRKAGAQTSTSVFRNLSSKEVYASIQEMKQHIDECHILALSGGFSAGDEPDGSGKFIANVLNNQHIKEAVHRLIDRGGLILGICNGFQALVKSGLLPYGRLNTVTEESPTLFRNNINRHISQMVETQVASSNSPWLSSFDLGEKHTIAMSHGEGKFMINKELAESLFQKGQIAFQYVDLVGNITTQAPYNPNGSHYAIEGIISENGQILGKMGHSERYEENLFKNIKGNKRQTIFENAVRYFTHQSNK